MIVLKFKTNIEMVSEVLIQPHSQYDLADDQVLFCRFCLNGHGNVQTSGCGFFVPFRRGPIRLAFKGPVHTPSMAM